MNQDQDRRLVLLEARLKELEENVARLMAAAEAEKPPLNRKEAAAYIGVCSKTLLSYTRMGLIKTIPGSGNKYSRTELNKHIIHRH